MKKKLTSALLSSLMLCQASSFSPTYATHKSVKHEESAISSKLLVGILGTVALTGVAIFLAPVLYDYFTSSQRGTNPALDAKRKLAFNDALRNLYNSDYKDQILNFPSDDAYIMFDDPNLDQSDRLAIGTALVLKDAFQLAACDSSAIDVTRKDSLFMTLNCSVNADKNLEDAIRDTVERAKNTIKSAPSPDDRLNNYIPKGNGEHEDKIPNPLLHSFKPTNSNVEPLIDHWNQTHDIPLRAFKWHSYLCWLHSTLLLFFYEPHCNDIITNFPIDEAWKMLRSCKNDKDKNNLRAMIYLSLIFKDLSGTPSGDPNRNVAYIDYRDTTREYDFIQALKLAFSCNDPEARDTWYGSVVPGMDHPGMFYGRMFTTMYFTPYLLNVIVETAKIENHSEEWRKFVDKVLVETNGAVTSKIPKLTMLNDECYFENTPNVKIMGDFLHHWLELDIGNGQKLSIVRNYYDLPENYIKIV